MPEGIKSKLTQKIKQNFIFFLHRIDQNTHKISILSKIKSNQQPKSPTTFNHLERERERERERD